MLKEFIYMSKIHSNQSINRSLKEGKVGIKTLNISKAFIDHSQATDDVYENLEDYDPAKKRSVLIVFDDMIADMEPNVKLSLIVADLFLRERKLNILLVFISQSYLKLPKTIRLNATHFITKIASKENFNK